MKMLTAAAKVLRPMARRATRADVAAHYNRVAALVEDCARSCDVVRFA